LSTESVLGPEAVVTTTALFRPVPAGVRQVTEVAVLALKEVQAAPPMVTPVAPLRLVPLMVTLVPPAVLPVLGVMPLTLGAGTV
jgi:hypothetical protein